MSNLLEKIIFNRSSIPDLTKLADLSALRQKLIASNIANVNTAGYQEKSMDFDEELKRAISPPKLASAPTNKRHIPLGNSPAAPPKIKSVKSTENSTGINSVDIDQQMADLAQNELIFNFGANMLAKKFKGLKTAIRGRF